MRSGRDKLLEAAIPRRRKRRLPRLAPGLLVVLIGGGIVALWVWVFSPIFIEPEEWHARQRRFERAVREVLRGPRTQGGVPIPELPDWPEATGDDQARLIACADAQVARGVRFSASYHPMRYPWGDLPEHLGTSADLLVRCLRSAGLDLQQLVHVDRKEHPREYPLRLWASRRPDRSIDHRRMPILYAFAQRFFERLPHEAEDAEQMARFQPGDVVFYDWGGTQGFPGLVALVSDRRDEDGVPRVVTLFPRDRRASGHHRLTDWPLAAHFRVPIDKTLERFLEANPSAILAPAPPPTAAEPDE